MGAKEKLTNGVFIVTVSLTFLILPTNVLKLEQILFIRIPLPQIHSFSIAFLDPWSGRLEKGLT